DDAALDEEVVPEVDVGLEGGQRLLPDLRAGEHRLQAGAVPALERDEAQLARVAQVHDPAGDADDVVRLLPRLQPGVPLPDGGDRRRHREGDGVGVDTLGQHPGALLGTHPDLLGNVLVVVLGGRHGGGRLTHPPILSSGTSGPGPALSSCGRAGPRRRTRGRVMGATSTGATGDAEAGPGADAVSQPGLFDIPPGARRTPVRVVLLTGPSGSGKTSLTGRLGLPVVSLDDFYRDG